MKIRIERREEPKQQCRFWTGRYTGPGLALYCKDKNGLRSYGVCPEETLTIGTIKDLSQVYFTSYPDNKWFLGIAPFGGKLTKIIAEFATEKEALIAKSKAEGAIRKMRISSRAWVFWLMAAILVIGFWSIPVKERGKEAAVSPVGKSQAADGLRRLPPPPSQDALQSQAVQAEPPARIDLSMLPPDSQAWGFGNPKGKPVYVFADPTCHYCGELDRALRSIGKNYFIHLYPTPIRGAAAVALVVNFACSSNPQGAWNKWMDNQTFDEKVKIEKECSSAALAAANQNIGIMKSLGFKGVPVIIRADGAAVNGAMTGDQLATWLSQSSK